MEAKFGRCQQRSPSELGNPVPSTLYLQYVLQVDRILGSAEEGIRYSVVPFESDQHQFVPSTTERVKVLQAKWQASSWAFPSWTVV